MKIINDKNEMDKLAMSGEINLFHDENDISTTYLMFPLETNEVEINEFLKGHFDEYILDKTHVYGRFMYVQIDRNFKIKAMKDIKELKKELQEKYKKEISNFNKKNGLKEKKLNEEYKKNLETLKKKQIKELKSVADTKKKEILKSHERQLEDLKGTLKNQLKVNGDFKREGLKTLKEKQVKKLEKLEKGVNNGN